MSAFEFDFSEMQEFFRQCDRASKGAFRQELELFLEGIGQEFLRILEDEIIRRKVMDSRLLLNSFHRGNDGNVWELSDGGLTLEVGTSVKYAQYVNDGHAQRPGRFVPGHWHGDRFIYEPGADTGMVLKAKWVRGSHYWEAALRILDSIYPKLVETKLQDWIDQYFGL